MFLNKAKTITGSLVLAAVFMLAQRGLADTATKQIIQTATRGSVLIENGKGGFGTGWIIDKARKIIITNHHVVGSNDTMIVKFPAYENGQLIHERPYYQ